MLSPFARANPPSLPKASCNRWLEPPEQAWSVQGTPELGHPTEGQVLVSVPGRSPPAPEYPRPSAGRSVSLASFEEPQGFVCVCVGVSTPLCVNVCALCVSSCADVHREQQFLPPQWVNSARQ